MEYIIGIGFLIYLIIYYTKQNKRSEERKQGLRNLDHAKEVAQAHRYILEEIGEVFTGGSPLIKLKKEINSELETISRPYAVHLNLSVANIQVFCTSPTYSGIVVDYIGYPLSGDDLKDIEERVADGTHFLDRDESGRRIRPK